MRKIVSMVAVAMLIAACSLIPTTQTQAVADLDAAYTATAALEKAWGGYCAQNAAQPACAATPWAKVITADKDAYAALKAANDAVAAGNSPAIAVAIAAAKTALPSLLTLIPAPSDPTLMIAYQAAMVAAKAFAAD